MKRARWGLILVGWRTPFLSHPSAPLSNRATSRRVRWRSLGPACGGKETKIGRSILPSFQHHRRAALKTTSSRRAVDALMGLAVFELTARASVCDTRQLTYSTQAAFVTSATVWPPKKSRSLLIAPP